MAFMALFVFMPERQVGILKEKEQLLRVGIESTNDSTKPEKLMSLVKSKKNDYEIIDLAHGIEAINGISNNVYDLVCTDFLSANFMVEQGMAQPLSYLKNEDRDISWERLLLVGHKKVPEFLMQTQGLKLILNGPKGKMERIVAERFLNYKLKNFRDWFSSVGVALSVDFAMNALKAKGTDLVLILESDFKRMYNEEQRTAFKVIWYSEPLPDKVVVMRTDLQKPLQEYSQELFKGKNERGEYWQPFNQSLLTMKDWGFRISGKSFNYDEKIVKENSIR